MYGVNRSLVELAGSLIGCWELHLRNSSSRSLVLVCNLVGFLDSDRSLSA